MQNVEPQPEPLAPVRKRSQQNKAMGEYITEAGVLLVTALTNPDVAARLATRSYDAAKIGAGVALQNAAQAAYNGRQSDLGDRFSSVSEQKQKFDEEKAEFDAFRTLARPQFTDKGARTDLGLSGSVPQDMSAFITWARAAYTNAKAEQFQTDLADLGYGIAQLDAELEELSALEAQMSERQSAGGGAQAATSDRNTAFRALKAWMDKLEGVATVALGADIYKMPFHELPRVSLPKAE